jgi:quinol-cytochrome oxidoreductase complex cytochrome b subunit
MYARFFTVRPARGAAASVSSKQVQLNWSAWIRQIHRWLAIVFTTIVLAIFITLGAGQQPAQWVYYLPLLPLFLLMFSGLFMFVLPYATKWRSARQQS